MVNFTRPCIIACVFLGGTLNVQISTANAADTQVQRGKYLVSVSSAVGFEVPRLGVFYGPNLTPDNETGLGKWTKEQIAIAITTGKRPDGRVLAPAMPVESFKHLTHSDALAIAAHFKTLPPIKNKVPGPFGPTETPTSFVYQVIPPDKYVPTQPPRWPPK